MSCIVSLLYGGEELKGNESSWIQNQIRPTKPKPDALPGTKKSLVLTYGCIGWAPLCSFSKHFLSAYYLLGVECMVWSNKDVYPAIGPIFWLPNPSPVFPKQINSQFHFQHLYYHGCLYKPLVETTYPSPD